MDTGLAIGQLESPPADRVTPTPGTVRVDLDPTSGEWSLDTGSRRYQVRPWTWGERRRLIDASTVGDPARLDRPAFVAALLQTVVRGPVHNDDANVVAAAALRCFGLRPGQQPMPLLVAEHQLVQRWGIGPTDLDRQPADRLDRHLVAPDATPNAAARQPGPDHRHRDPVNGASTPRFVGPGARSIVIVDD